MIENLLLAAKFETSDAFSLVAIILLVAMSAFFSASETSFSTVNTVRIKAFAEDKVKGARRAQYIIDHYDFALICFLVGNNLLNIANTTLCAYFFSKFILNATLSNLVNTIVMTILILVFAEILPKAYAKHYAEKFVLKVSGIVYFIVKLIYILAWPFYKIQKLFIKGGDETIITEDEFETMVDTMEDQGIIDSENADMIHSVLDISEQTVYDICVPRVDMLALPVTATTKEIKEMFVVNQFSRIPVFDGDKDNIVGILNYKDYFIAQNENGDVDLKSILTEPLKVTETMKVDELIKIMQKEKKHMAVVVDEYGGTSGIVTMEDAIEHMIGKIYDEPDEAEGMPIQQVEENKYLVDPDVSIEDLFEFLLIEHLPETKYSSVGGMIYELAETMPHKGSVVKIKVQDDILDEDNNYITVTNELTFVVEGFDDDRIQKLSVVNSRVEEKSEDE